jgi:hypothetical protein
MNKEKYNQIIDEAHKRYVSEMWFHPEDNWLEELDGMDMSTGERKKVYRQYAQEEFINKCKTDSEFSEKWGLKIEERELSLEERYGLVRENGLCPKYSFEIENGKPTPNKMSESEWYDNHNIPTKLITITYNDKTIESYE